MSRVLSYADFVNEALVVVKRKYTEKHPEKAVSDYAPVRERVLSFVKEKGQVKETELVEFFKLMNEETGRKTSMDWMKANTRFFTTKTVEGEKTYSLSKEGARIHEKITSLK